MTSNQFYGGLNRRFEKRAKLLRRLGFAYASIEIAPRSTLAVFTRRRSFTGRTGIIAAATVAHAVNRAWFDALRAAI